MTLQTINVGICDDEAFDRNRIKEAVENHAAVLTKDVRFHIRLFPSAQALTEANLVSAFDLVFLDIVMPGEDGFQLARHLCAGKVLPRIIFVSNHDNLIFDSQEYLPFWFVRKGQLERDIRLALAKYLELVSVRKISYKLKNGFGYREILLADMVYIECSGHELTVKMKDGSCYQIYGSLKSMEDELSPLGFIRVHRNFLVNQAYVADVAQRDILLLDGIEIPVGKDRKKAVAEAMVLYRRRLHGIP